MDRWVLGTPVLDPGVGSPALVLRGPRRQHLESVEVFSGARRPGGNLLPATVKLVRPGFPDAPESEVTSRRSQAMFPGPRDSTATPFLIEPSPHLVRGTVAVYVWVIGFEAGDVEATDLVDAVAGDGLAATPGATFHVAALDMQLARLHPTVSAWSRHGHSSDHPGATVIGDDTGQRSTNTNDVAWRQLVDSAGDDTTNRSRNLIGLDNLDSSHREVDVSKALASFFALISFIQVSCSSALAISHLSLPAWIPATWARPEI